MISSVRLRPLAPRVGPLHRQASSPVAYQRLFFNGKRYLYRTVFAWQFIVKRRSAVFRGVSSCEHIRIGDAAPPQALLNWEKSFFLLPIILDPASH